MVLHVYTGVNQRTDDHAFSWFLHCVCHKKCGYLLCMPHKEQHQCILDIDRFKLGNCFLEFPCIVVCLCACISWLVFHSIIPYDSTACMPCSRVTPADPPDTWEVGGARISSLGSLAAMDLWRAPTCCIRVRWDRLCYGFICCGIVWYGSFGMVWLLWYGMKSHIMVLKNGFG